MDPFADLATLAALGSESIFRGFLDDQQRFLRLTRRVRQRFEKRDWTGIRHDTVERLGVHSECVARTFDSVQEQLGDRFRDRLVWYEMKAAYTRIILGRDDFELARTFFNSLTRRVFPHVGVDPAIDFVAKDFPLPFAGWEMASARTYSVPRIDEEVVTKVLEDAGFQIPFHDLGGDARILARRINEAVERAFGSGEIDGLDVLRPVLIRNKAAYIVARARRVVFPL